MPPNAVKKEIHSVSLFHLAQKNFEEEEKEKSKVSDRKKERGKRSKKKKTPHTDNAPTTLQDYLLAMQ